MLNFFTQLPVAVQAAGLLVLSNCFMTFAWYGHLKYLSGSAWYVAAVVSWSIALFEYLLQVPANRIGFSELSLWLFLFIGTALLKHWDGGFLKIGTEA